jgi:hypothetical protein
MLPLGGDFREPLAGLAIHVMQIGELTQRPETLACIADRALHLAFFPTRRGIAGTRVEAIFAREAEKARKKTHQAAIVLGHGGSEIIIGDLARDATHCGEGMHVAADESFKALAVSELQIEHALWASTRANTEFGATLLKTGLAVEALSLPLQSRRARRPRVCWRKSSLVSLHHTS